MGVLEPCEHDGEVKKINLWRHQVVEIENTQCTTSKLSKNVLHMGDICAQREQCPEKIEMKFLIKIRPFSPILKTKGQFMVNNGSMF